MIQVRGGLLFHAHSARGALLQQQAKHRSLSSAFTKEFSSSSSLSISFSISSVKNPLSSRGFRGFLSACDRENNNFAHRSFHVCSKHNSILALWSFETRSSHCDDASRLRKPKALHTSTSGKLTTSDLIKRLQLAKSTGSKSGTSSKALPTDHSAIQGRTDNLLVVDEKVHGSTNKFPVAEFKPSSDKPDKGTSDVGTEKKPLSKLIPQHVVDRGFLKKESFSKNQTLQSYGSGTLQKSCQTGPNQRQKIPVLELSSTRKDAADESATSKARRNSIQEKVSDRWRAPQVLQMSSRGRNAAGDGFVKRRGLLAAGFEKVSSSNESGKTDPFGGVVASDRQLAQTGESTEVPRKQHDQDREHLRNQTQDREESRNKTHECSVSASSIKESSQVAGRLRVVSTSSAETLFQHCTERERVAGDQGKFIEKQSEIPQESITLPGVSSTKTQFQRHKSSTELAGESAAEKQLARFGESRKVVNKQQFQDREELKKRSLESRDGASLSKESSELAGRPGFLRKRLTEVSFQEHIQSERIAGVQHVDGGKFTEKVGEKFTEKGTETPQDSKPSSGVSSTKMQIQPHRESVDLAGESTAYIPYTSTSEETAGMQPLMDTVSQHHQHGERIDIVGKQPFARRVITENQFSLHQESTKSAAENGEIVCKQPFHTRLSSYTQFQRPNEGVESLSRQPFYKRQPSDMQFQIRRESHVFDPRASDTLLPGESVPAAPRKPFDRNRPKKKCKNDLKEKDLSVLPIAGEPHYEYLIRRKRVRAETQKALVDDVEDYEHVGDDWVRKRIGWLCKELPVLKASGLVKMLNKQRQWIKQAHLVELIEHLVRYMELNRAHRVLKWMQQQPLYEFEYELHNNMAFILGRNDKLSRCQDVFDEIVRNGKFPDASVFTALIKAYLHKGDQGDINDAWKLYNQMLQLGLTVSPSLSETLLKSLSCPTGRWIRQAEELLVKMRASGLYINEEMYNRVMDIYGKRGDHKKLDALVDEMKKEHLEIDVNGMNARLAACVKDGDTKRAEMTFRQIIELGLKPNWHSYAYLIQIYGKANLPDQAWEIFEKMKGENIPVNFVTYHAIIEAMAADGLHVEQVMQVLTEVETSGIKPLQPCYNSVMNMYLRLKRHGEVESIFNRGKASKARPGHAAYNMLMKSYTDSGQLEKAEAVFQEMKKTEGMGPNTHTYNILLEGYGVACFKSKVRELFEEMSAKGCQLDPDVKTKIQSMIGVKKIVELEKKKLTLTDEQREIIPGLLLGGAKMESPDRNRTYELHLQFNCENQVTRVVKDHLSFLFQAWWKQNQSAASTKCEGSPVEASATNSIVRLETVSHGSLRFYAHQYRPNGEPVIPKLIHRWLKPRTLAYWYMYGGRKCRSTGGIVLNASKYPGKQIQLVVKSLKARTMDCRRKKKRNGDVIRFEGKSAVWLWKLMEPHILKAVKEQLKPEEIPVNLAFADGNESWESDDQGSSDSDDDDWDDLEAEKDEVLACT
eukprot:c24961_g1_i1 orf=56-4504(+)